MNKLTFEQVEERLIPVLQKICHEYQPRSTGKEQKRWDDIYSPLYSLLLDVSIAKDDEKKDTTRDKQFWGFSKLLWEEIKETFGNWYEFDNDNIHNEAQEIIAQRAYDLVVHAVSESINSLDASHVPDMTELPKEQDSTMYFVDLGGYHGSQALEILEPPKEQEPELITLERFLAMIDERGLSSHQYEEPRYSSSFGSYTTRLIDVCKDGKVLATYDIGAVIETVFTEKHMAQELDGLLDK